MSFAPALGTFRRESLFRDVFPGGIFTQGILASDVFPRNIVPGFVRCKAG